VRKKAAPSEGESSQADWKKPKIAPSSSEVKLKSTEQFWAYSTPMAINNMVKSSRISSSEAKLDKVISLRSN
jgi:hypothetical protein